MWVVGFLFVYSFVMVVFGGFMLVILIGFIYMIGDKVVLGYWMSFVVVCVLLVMFVFYCWYVVMLMLVY